MSLSTIRRQLHHRHHRVPPREVAGHLTGPVPRAIVHNDNFTTMEFVIYVLHSVFQHTESAAIEIMLNAANINLVAFWRYREAAPGEGPLTGVMMALFVITIAAAEVAVGIGLILLCYRRWKAADVDRYDSLAG